MGQGSGHPEIPDREPGSAVDPSEILAGNSFRSPGNNGTSSGDTKGKPRQGSGCRPDHRPIPLGCSLRSESLFLPHQESAFFLLLDGATSFPPSKISLCSFHPGHCFLLLAGCFLTDRAQLQWDLLQEASPDHRMPEGAFMSYLSEVTCVFMALFACCWQAPGGQRLI